MTSLILVKFNLQNALYIGEVNEKERSRRYVMGKNRKYNNNKRRSYYPSDVSRIDPELASEVRLALMLGIPEEVVMRNYRLTYRQIDYCKKNGKSFKELKKEYDE